MIAALRLPVRLFVSSTATIVSLGAVVYLSSALAAFGTSFGTAEAMFFIV